MPQKAVKAKPADAPASSDVLGLKELRTKIKRGAIVLWPYRGDVESGDVLSVAGERVDLIWLEGYKSRNDTVQLDEILAIHDPKGPDHELFPFNGKGYLTEAGVKWKQEHPRN